MEKTHEGEKDLVQGIILVAAALVHYQKYENDICLSIMNRAMDKFVNVSGMYYGIDVNQFQKIVGMMISSRSIAPFMI